MGREFIAPPRTLWRIRTPSTRDDTIGNQYANARIFFAAQEVLGGLNIFGEVPTWPERHGLEHAMISVDGFGGGGFAIGDRAQQADERGLMFGMSDFSPE